MAAGQLEPGLRPWPHTVSDALTVLSVLALIFRVPGSLFLVVGAAAVQLLILTWKPVDRRARLWIVVLFFAVVAALLSLLLRTAPPEVVNFATITLAFLLLTLTLTMTKYGARLARLTMTTCYWSFALILLIGIGEIISGWRLVSVIYPGEPVPETLSRFEVSAFYPNYNDFSVVLAMFVTMTLVRAMFDYTSRVRLVFQLGVVGVVMSLILLQGSRGTLGAVLVAGALVLWLGLRTQVSSKLMTQLTVLAFLFIGTVGVLVWSSSWVQDSSTRARDRIVANVLEMTPDTSLEFWVGYGSDTAYDAAAAQLFPATLMDPHNVMLETFIWYGLPVTVLFVAFWASVVFRGLWGLKVPLDWRSLSAVLLVSLIPVLGVVPSSTYRYYFIFLFGAVAVVVLSNWRPTWRAT